MASDDERWDRAKRAAQMRASGISVAEISDALKIQPKTIEQDLARFYKRFLDFQLLDGTALGELLHQVDNIIALGLAGYSKASRIVFGPRGEPLERPDYYARRQYLATALDAIKEKSAILGFKRNEASPILQIIQGDNNEVKTLSASGIAPENVPALRELMRKTRTLMNRDPVKTAGDVERRMLAHGVKDPPYEHELPGVLIEKDSGDGEHRVSPF